MNLSTGSNWGIGLYNTLSESNIETEKNYTSNLGVQFYQPLLKGFGKDLDRSNIYFARIMSESSMDNLEITAIDLVYNVQRAYWDLVYARETLEIREISLAQADSLLAYNEKGLSLGILTESPQAYFDKERSRALAQQSIEPAVIDKMVQERNEARASKDWERADKIRKQLEEMNIILEDRPEGTIWKTG